MEKRNLYETPAVEVVDCVLEQGFAATRQSILDYSKEGSVLTTEPEDNVMEF